MREELSDQAILRKKGRPSPITYGPTTCKSVLQNTQSSAWNMCLTVHHEIYHDYWGRLWSEKGGHGWL
jgi:hypothetical protein